MALLKITHFWSNLLAWRYQHNFPIWGYQHNFPIWGYQHNFPSGGTSTIFQSGGTSTIFQSEVPAQFPNLGYQHIFQILWSDLLAWGYQHIFSTLHGSLWLGKDKGSIMESTESGGTTHLEINFLSKVYSKSLPRGLHGAKPIDLYFDIG